MADEGFVPTGAEDVENGVQDAVATDFNVEEEYKPIPLAPASLYRGSVFGVKYNPKTNTIDWDVVLNDNGGVCNDGVTPVDGIHLEMKNWLPNEGDQNQMTKNGKQTKRQSKINMLKDFADKMKLNMNSSAIIKEAIQNSAWVGRNVSVTVIVAEYQGRYFNRINTMVSAD